MVENNSINNYQSLYRLCAEVLQRGNTVFHPRKLWIYIERWCSIQENCGYTLNFAPDWIKASKRSLSSIENVTDTL